MIDQFNNPSGTEATYNQAQQQQFRINESLVLANRLGINPLYKNEELGGLYNYEIIFNCLCNVLYEINSKLKPDEQKSISKFKDIINEFLSIRPIFNFITEDGMRKKITRVVNNKNWKELKDMLYQFRIQIEYYMDIHGFGNPNKRDPSKAVTEMN